MTPTYDTDKVDALVRALNGLERELPAYVTSALQALKPQPEMEYVPPQMCCLLWRAVYGQGQSAEMYTTVGVRAVIDAIKSKCGV